MAIAIIIEIIAIWNYFSPLYKDESFPGDEKWMNRNILIGTSLVLAIGIVSFIVSRKWSSMVYHNKGMAEAAGAMTEAQMAFDFLHPSSTSP